MSTPKESKGGDLHAVICWTFVGCAVAAMLGTRPTPTASPTIMPAPPAHTANTQLVPTVSTRPPAATTTTTTTTANYSATATPKAATEDSSVEAATGDASTGAAVDAKWYAPLMDLNMLKGRKATECEPHPQQDKARSSVPSFREMIAGRGTSSAMITCERAPNDNVCSYNCGARPQGFMRPRLYTLQYDPDSTVSGAGTLYLPFVDNDAWNRDYLCNKRGLAHGSDLTAARVAAQTGDAAFFDGLLSSQPELRLELEWQIVGAGANATQTLALRVNGTAPASYITYTDPTPPTPTPDSGKSGPVWSKNMAAAVCHRNPLREAPGSSSNVQKDLTKTVYLVRHFFDFEKSAKATADGDDEADTATAKTAPKSTCRPVPEVEDLGGEGRIPMACAHGLCTKMCCSPMVKPDNTVVVSAPVDNPAQDATARIVMDKDGVRIVVRAQWRAAPSMQSMRPGADLVDHLWPPLLDTARGIRPGKDIQEQMQRYKKEGGRLELNHLGNLQLSIGDDMFPVAVWGEDLNHYKVLPWCEDLAAVPFTTEDEKAITILKCMKYENREPFDYNVDYGVDDDDDDADTAVDAYTAVRATARPRRRRGGDAGDTDADTEAYVPGGASAVRDQREHQRGAQPGGVTPTPQCIIAPPAGAPACRAISQANLVMTPSGGYVDPAGMLDASTCELRAKRWARMCGWPTPVSGANSNSNPAMRTSRTQSTQAEASFGSFISGVGSAAKSVGSAATSVGSAVGGVAKDAVGIAKDAVGAVGDVVDDADSALFGRRSKWHDTCFDMAFVGVPGGRLPIVFQVTQFEDPANDIGDTRTTGTALLRHGDAIRSNHIELVVLNSHSVPVLTVMDTVGEDKIVRRPLVVGGTVFDHRSWPSGTGPNGPQTYTVDVTHSGLRMTAGEGSFALMFVQSRILQEKQTREEWKCVAALLLPVPVVGGPVVEFDHVREYTTAQAATGMGAEMTRYWGSATSTTYFAPNGNGAGGGGGSTISMGSISSGGGSGSSSGSITTTSSSTSTTTTGGTAVVSSTFKYQLGDASTHSLGYGFGADGGYSLLESDYAHSPDFMDTGTSMHLTEVGTYYAAHHSEKSNAWRQNVMWGSIVGLLLLLAVGYRAFTAKTDDADTAPEEGAHT